MINVALNRKRMNVNIKYFGKLTDFTKCSEEVLPIKDDQSLEIIMTELYQKYPGLENTIHALFVNNKKVDKQHSPINNNDNLILMPPFSGG